MTGAALRVSFCEKGSPDFMSLWLALRTRLRAGPLGPESSAAPRHARHVPRRSSTTTPATSMGINLTRAGTNSRPSPTRTSYPCPQRGSIADKASQA